MEVHGTLTRTSASSGPEGWLLTTGDGTMLAVTIPSGAANPMAQRCVKIAIDDDFPDADDPVPALEQVMNDTGEALRIIEFC